jgi:hypothetical protein
VVLHAQIENDSDPTKRPTIALQTAIHTGMPLNQFAL